MFTLTIRVLGRYNSLILAANAVGFTATSAVNRRNRPSVRDTPPGAHRAARHGGVRHDAVPAHRDRASRAWRRRGTDLRDGVVPRSGRVQHHGPGRRPGPLAGRRRSLERRSSGWPRPPRRSGGGWAGTAPPFPCPSPWRCRRPLPERRYCCSHEPTGAPAQPRTHEPGGFSQLLPHRHMRAALVREQLARPVLLPPVAKTQSREPSHQVQLGGPGVPERDGPVFGVGRR